MQTTIYEPEHLTPEYEPVNGQLDTEAGGVVTDTGTVGVLAVERGIELRIEEKVPKGDSEALGDAVRMLVST